MKTFVGGLIGAVALLAGLIAPAGPVVAGTVTVSGSVTSVNGSVDKGTVFFYASCQDYTNHTAASSAAITSGTYSALVPSGTYRVFIEVSSWNPTAADSWHAGAASCEAATVVQLAASGNLDLVAAPLLTLTGTMSSRLGVMPNATLTLYRSCEEYYTDKSVASTTSDGNGLYSVKVPAGTYRIRIQATGPTWNTPGKAPSWHPGATRCEDALEVVVLENTARDLNAAAPMAASGGVSTFHGPVTQGEVRFFATCRDYDRDRNALIAWHAAGTSTIASDGTYGVTLAEGRYRVWVNPMGSTTALAAWHTGSASCEKATEVLVSGAGRLDLTTRGVGNLTGTVTAGKTRVANGWLSFFADCENASRGQWVDNLAFTGGSFTTTLPDGSYLVLIRSSAAKDSWHPAAQGCSSAVPIVVTGRTVIQLKGLTAAQGVKRPPKSIAVGKRVVLARKTDRGVRVRWQSLTKDICTVRKNTVRGLRKGTCRLSAKTQLTIGLDTLSRKFRIRVT